MMRRRRPYLWLTGALLIVAAIIGALAQQASYYPYIAFQSGESLRIVFLQHAQRAGAACQATTNRVVEAVLAQCPACRLVENRCLDQLDARQRKILSGQPVDVPVMRTPGGVSDI